MNNINQINYSESIIRNAQINAANTLFIAQSKPVINSTHNERLAKHLAFELGLPYELILKTILDYEVNN